MPVQLLGAHLNRICAMSDLRTASGQSCLIGVLGEGNAGKTTLVDRLTGREPNLNGFEPENTTTYVAANIMQLHTSDGLQALPASPRLLDTPGLFDRDPELQGVVQEYSGECARSTNRNTQTCVAQPS